MRCARTLVVTYVAAVFFILSGVAPVLANEVCPNKAISSPSGRSSADVQKSIHSWNVDRTTGEVRTSYFLSSSNSGFEYKYVDGDSGRASQVLSSSFSNVNIEKGVQITNSDYGDQCNINVYLK